MVGGGAAGATLALMLARQGISVTLCDDGRAHYSGPYETVLASTRSTWQSMGLLDLVSAGAEVDPLRHGAIWGSPELVWRDDPEPGLLLQRGLFDRALRAAADRAGAHVVEGARAERVDEGWLVGDDLCMPRVVAFATGRRQGVAELPAYRRDQRQTLAVTLRGRPAEQDRGTGVVEAVADGWLWTQCPHDGPASVAVLLDAHAGHGGLRGRVDAMLAAALGPARHLEDVEVVRANDASPRLRSDGGDVLVLGDAAGTIDPLASQGVEKAIAAADHAAAAIATGLQREDLWPRLRRVHAQWERELCAIHWQTSAGFYERESRFADCDFWRARREHDAAPILPSQTPVQWSPGVERRQVLMRHGDGFAEVDGLVDRHRRFELARVGRVPVAALWELLRCWSSIDETLQRAQVDPRLFVLSPRDVYDAVQWLYAKGWLVTRPESAPTNR